MSDKGKNKSQPPEEEILDHILTFPESDQFDFKRVCNVASIVKTAAAMANTHGGVIVLGVDDPKKRMGMDRVFGLNENPEAFSEIKAHLASRVTPPLDEPHSIVTFKALTVNLRDGTKGEIVLAFVEKSNAVHSLVDGGTYARVGPQNRQLSAVQITELSLRRGVQSAVDALVDVPHELLDTLWWHEYADQRQLTRSMVDAMKHLGLIRKNREGRWQPTVAAVLLFAEHPGQLLQRKCAIRIFHYQGHDIEHQADTNLARRPMTIDGPILKQIQTATAAVIDEITSGTQVSASGFEFLQRYPRRVIQEAITNAVIHRDYQYSQDTRVRIFTNRIEIESPGIFPGAVTSENIGKIGSRPRNRAIVDHLREFPKPPNLDAGEGVKMMFEVMEQDGLYPPTYEEKSEHRLESIEVTLRNEARLSEWALVEDYLATHKSIRNTEVRHILNLGEDRVKASKLLRDWVEKDLLEIANPQEGTRKRYYRLKTTRQTPLGQMLINLLSKARESNQHEVYKALIKQNLEF